MRPFYPHPLYGNPLYRRQAHRARPCPVAERSSKDAFWLPMPLFMGNEDDAADAARAIAKVHRAFRHSSPRVTNGSAAG